MKTTNKIVYFIMGALFAATIGWSFYRPVDATAPTTVERKVTVLSEREVGRIQGDIANLERSIQDDHNFLAGKFPYASGKGNWSAQNAQKKHDIEETLPRKENDLATLKSQLGMLRM